MFKKILLAVVILVAVFVVFVSTRPGDFRVSRSTTIAAPPAAVFPHVNDLHEFQKWSPWAKMDPDAKVSYSGPASGEGSSFSWAGEKTGEGTMTLAESKPDERVRFNLVFRKPFDATNDVEFTFKPEGAGTVATWTMTGRNNFIAKAMGVIMDTDKMVGGQFEEGLAGLKTLSEAKP